VAMTAITGAISGSPERPVRWPHPGAEARRRGSARGQVRQDGDPNADVSASRRETAGHSPGLQ
jgi:hypothetical protein